MDKIQAIGSTQHHTEKFTYLKEEWSLDTQWGEAILRRLSKNEYYAFDIEASSTFSLSLVVMAIKGESDPGVQVKMNLKIMEDDNKIAMQIQSQVEQYSYIFRKREVDYSAIIVEDLEKLKIRCTTLRKKMPITGTLRPIEWKEHSLNDIVTEFDFSFLELKKHPLIFTNIEGKCGYAAVYDITSTKCNLYLHWNNLETLPPMDKTDHIAADSLWKIAYCIFPQEGVPVMEENLEEQKLQLEEELSTYEGVEAAVEAGRQLVIFENKVLDISNFLSRHPGTPAPLIENVGLEIGRWIYGSFEHKELKHRHSGNALQLMAKYLVGVINIPGAAELFRDIPEGRTIKDYTFKLLEQEMLTDTHFLIRLKNPNIQIHPQFTDISSYGRYCSLTSLKKSTTRNYALSFCADESILKAHQQLLEAFEEKAKYDTPFPEINEIIFDNITLVVKKNREFSTWLSELAQPDSEFQIGGPYGRGLNISTSAKGHLIILSTGTPVLLFLDLILYLTRMNVYNFGKVAGEEYKIFADEDFEYLSDPSFKLTVYCSFPSIKKAPFGSLLKKIESLMKNNEAKNLELFIRESEVTPAKWDKAFYQKQVPLNAEKVFIVGKKDFVTTTYDNLISLGLSKDTLIQYYEDNNTFVIIY